MNQSEVFSFFFFLERPNCFRSVYCWLVVRPPYYLLSKIYAILADLVFIHIFVSFFDFMESSDGQFVSAYLSVCPSICGLFATLSLPVKCVCAIYKKKLCDFFAICVYSIFPYRGGKEQQHAQKTFFFS